MNQRTDSYGGSFDNRIRFCMEIARGIKKMIPPCVALVCQLSCGDPGPLASWSFEDWYVTLFYPFFFIGKLSYIMM